MPPFTYFRRRLTYNYYHILAVRGNVDINFTYNLGHGLKVSRHGYIIPNGKRVGVRRVRKPIRVVFSYFERDLFVVELQVYVVIPLAVHSPLLIRIERSGGVRFFYKPLPYTVFVY